MDSEQLDSAKDRTDQPTITDFFKPELTTSKDRVQDLERRLREEELLKARLERKMTIFVPKMVNFEKSPDLDPVIVQQTVQFQEQRRNQVLRVSLRSLKIRLISLKLQLKIHLLSQRAVVAIGPSHLVRKLSKALRPAYKE